MQFYLLQIHILNDAKVSLEMTLSVFLQGRGNKLLWSLKD